MRLHRSLLATACITAMLGATPVMGVQWLRGHPASEVDNGIANHQKPQRKAQEEGVFTLVPTVSPTKTPSFSPTSEPTVAPSTAPTGAITGAPSTDIPTSVPSMAPTAALTMAPSKDTATPAPFVSVERPTDPPITLESNGTDSNSNATTPLVVPTPAPFVSVERPTANNATNANSTMGPMDAATAPTKAPSASPTPALTRPPTEPEGPEMTSVEEEDEDNFVAQEAPPVAATDTEIANDEAPADSLQTLLDGAGLNSDAAKLDSTSTTDAATSNTVVATKDNHYNGIKWIDLPMSTKAAAMTLGHTEETWNFGTKVATDYLKWENLSPEEEMAATLLEYTQVTWDAKVASAADAATDSEGHHSSWGQPTEETTDTGTEDESGGDTMAVVDFLSMTWDELPQAQKLAAVDLGYDQTTWGQDAIVFSRYLHWNQMDWKLRQAAKALGFRQISWNTAVVENQAEAEAAGSPTFYSDSFGAATADDSGVGTTSSGASASLPSSFTQGRRPVRYRTSSTEAEVEAKQEVGGDTIAFDLEPKMDSMKSDMDELKNELKIALDMIQVHEQILRVLANLDPEAPIGTVQELVAVKNRKFLRRKNNRAKQRAKQQEEVAPVSSTFQQ